MAVYLALREIAIPEMPKMATRMKHLYVVGEVGAPSPVKIGRARHAGWRLTSLQGGNHRRLELRAVWEADEVTIHTLEGWLLRRFREHFVSGEWVNATVEDVIYAVGIWREG